MTGAVLSAVLDAAGPAASVLAGFGPVTADVPRERWAESLAAAAGAGASFFDLLTAYDLGDDGFAVVAHVATPDASEHVVLRTRVPREDASVPTATGVYRGAAWHERETHEMYGIAFPGHPGLEPLLLPGGFGAHPLRKDFVLAARAARPWPGHAEPTDAGGRARRRTLPPGVPGDWPGAGARGQEVGP